MKKTKFRFILILTLLLVGCSSPTNSSENYDEYAVPYTKEVLDESHEEFLRQERNQAAYEQGMKGFK